MHREVLREELEVSLQVAAGLRLVQRSQQSLVLAHRRSFRLVGMIERRFREHVEATL